MRQRSGDRAFISNEFTAQDVGSAVKFLFLEADRLVTASTNTVNPCAPRAMKLVGIGAHSTCLIVNSAGNWTLRIRVNESGSDSATFSLGMAALPGSKNAGPASADIILQPGDTYHLLADGPSRNVALLRVNLLWEIL